MINLDAGLNDNEKEYSLYYPSYEYKYQCLLCGKEKYWPIDGNSYQIEMDHTEFRKLGEV